MSIDSFKAQVSDLLRPNLFAVYISPSFVSQQFLNGIGIFCHSASYPMQTFTTNGYFNNNKDNRFVSGIDYDPATFSFYCDAGNRTFNFFEAWRQQIIDINHMIGFKDNYKSIVEVEILDRNMNVNAKAILRDAVPVNIDSINLSSAASSEVLSMNVAFEFTEAEYIYIENDILKSILNAAGLSHWGNIITAGNIRYGMDIVNKIKSYRSKITNPNVYDIYGMAKKVGNYLNANSLVNKSKNVMSDKLKNMSENKTSIPSTSPKKAKRLVSSMKSTFGGLF